MEASGKLEAAEEKIADMKKGVWPYLKVCRKDRRDERLKEKRLKRERKERQKLYEEASAYFRIGEHKLRNLIDENKNADCLCGNTNRVRIKRVKFEKIVDTFRRDSKRRVLRPGESIRADGKYQYKYHIDGKPHFVYSWKLEPTDKLPPGKSHAFPYGNWKSRLIPIWIG